MHRLPSSALLAVLVGCGPATTVHPNAVPSGCPATPIVLAGQDDVAALAGCRTVGGVTIRTGAPLRIAPLSRLAAITGDLVIGPTVGLDEVALAELRSIDGALRVVANGNLNAVFLPRLEHVASIEIDGNVALTTLSLPRLESVTEVAIGNNAGLELVDVSSLATVSKQLAITGNPRLVMIEADKLAKIGGLRVDNNALLPAELVEALKAKAAYPPGR